MMSTKTRQTLPFKVNYYSSDKNQTTRIKKHYDSIAYFTGVHKNKKIEKVIATLKG